MPETNGTARFDRIESALALLIDDHVQFGEEHKLLLTAQVLLTDRMDKLTKTMADLAEAQKRTDQRFGELAEAGKHTDDRLNALITIVGIIHKPPQQ